MTRQFITENVNLIIDGKEVTPVEGNADASSIDFSFEHDKTLDPKALSSNKYIGRLAYTARLLLDLMLLHTLSNESFKLYLKAYNETFALLKREGVYLPEKTERHIYSILSEKYPLYGGCQQQTPCV